MCAVVAVHHRTVDQIAARLWSKVEKRGPDECWPYIAKLNTYGYGDFGWDSKHNTMNASRAVWIVTHGAIESHQIVCHSCDYRACCNPAHLWLGSKADNHYDAVAKQRHAFGVRHGNAKLNDEAVRSIRAQVAAGAPRSAMAEAFGVSLTLVRMIVTARAWRHVQEAA